MLQKVLGYPCTILATCPCPDLAASEEKAEAQRTQESLVVLGSMAWLKVIYGAWDSALSHTSSLLIGQPCRAVLLFTLQMRKHFTDEETG